jgi:hypothetical protein
VTLSKLKVLLLALVIFESDGLVTSFLGFDKILGDWVYAAVMCLFCGVAFYIMIIEKAARELKAFYYPLLALIVFFLVSFVSAVFLFPKPINEWLPSLYAFVPIFIFYYLYVFKYNSKEVVWGLIIVSTLISFLLLVDQFHYLSFLDQYQRRSIFFLESRRIVILKNEIIFGFVAVVSLIVVDRKSMFNNKLLIGLAILIFFVQALVMESRMGFLAMGVACITLFYLKGLTKKTFRLFSVALITVTLVFPFVFNNQVNKLSQMSINDSESNISIRLESFEHFYQLYLQSNGVGIGMMSSSGRINNVLNLVENFNIVDVGAFSALFQFGPLGLFIYLLFTINSLQTYRRYYKVTGNNDPYSAAAFAFIMGFTISLLPLSFFTSSWCISMGGVLLYLMWYFRNKLALPMHADPLQNG